MKHYRILLTTLIAISLVFASGCSRNADSQDSSAQNDTQSVENKQIDPDMPKLTQDDIQKIMSDIKLEELTQDLSKLKRHSSIVKKLQSHKEACTNTIDYIYYGQPDKKMHIFPETELPEDYDPTSRVWYSKAVENAPYVSEVYYDQLTQKYILTISTPVLKGGEMTGVVGIDVVVGTKGVGTPASQE